MLRPRPDHAVAATAPAAETSTPDPAPALPTEPGPPCGGRWVRGADGSLTPADETTAHAAGLAWPG